MLPWKLQLPSPWEGGGISLAWVDCSRAVLRRWVSGWRWEHCRQMPSCSKLCLPFPLWARTHLGYWVVGTMFCSGTFIFPDSKLSTELREELVCRWHPEVRTTLESVRVRWNLCNLASWLAYLIRFARRHFRGEFSCQGRELPISKLTVRITNQYMDGDCCPVLCLVMLASFLFLYSEFFIPLKIA